MRQLLWAQGWSRYGSSARCPRNRRGWLRLHQAPAHRCVHTAGARCHGLDRPIRPDQGRSPARSPFPVRSEPLPASGSAGYAAYPLPGVRPPGSCRLAGAVRRCAAPGPVPGEVGAVLTLSARQTGSLWRFGYPPLAVEVVVGVVLTRAHRPTVCQGGRRTPVSAGTASKLTVCVSFACSAWS